LTDVKLGEIVPVLSTTCDLCLRSLGQIDRNFKKCGKFSIFTVKHLKTSSGGRIVVIFQEIGVYESDGDVGILNGSAEPAVFALVQ